MTRFLANLNTWPLTGKRRQQAITHWLISLAVAAVFVIGVITIGNANTHNVGVVLIALAVLAAVVQFVYKLKTAATRPQLLRREYTDAKQRSTQNSQDIEAYLAEKKSEVEK